MPQAPRAAPAVDLAKIENNWSKTKVRYDTDGNALVLHVGRSATLPSETGSLAKSSYQAVASPYSIQNGKVVTQLANTPFTLAVYKLGDTYCGARSNEFGYANYELSSKGPAKLVHLGKGGRETEDQASYLHTME